MAAIEPLCQLLGIGQGLLSREELIVLEAELFLRICDEVKAALKQESKEYLKSMKVDVDKEEAMLEDNIMRCVVNDILLTGEYNLSGIAYYTQIPEEVIFEVAAGRNESPSVLFWHRMIGLHKTVRPKLYQEIVKKIVADYLPAT
jgi:hypothetical protein